MTCARMPSAKSCVIEAGATRGTPGRAPPRARKRRARGAARPASPRAQAATSPAMPVGERRRGRRSPASASRCEDARRRVGCANTSSSTPAERASSAMLGCRRRTCAIAADGSSVSSAVEQRGNAIARDEMVGEADEDRVGGAPRSPPVSARWVPSSPGAPREQLGGADVGNEPDRHLRHAQLRPLGDDAVGAVRRDTDAAAQHDAVHDRDVRLRVARDARVEDVLVAPEVARRSVPSPPVTSSVDRDDVAASAEPTLPGTGDRDRARPRRRRPSASSAVADQHAPSRG